jgi:hypothetical protein
MSSPRPRAGVVAGVLVAVLLGSLGAARAEGSRGLRYRYKQLAAEVGKLARGLETSLLRGDVNTASQLYRLEVKSVRLLQQIYAGTYADPTKQLSALSVQKALHADILRLQERVLEHALKKLDVAFPGEPMREMWAREGIDLYRPLFRQGTPVPGAPPIPGKQILTQMQRAFLDDGGSFDDIKWLGPRALGMIESGELVEWVQLGERFRLTAAGAKHPVIADGASVRGAGSLKIYRNAQGTPILAIVSNSSGNYKPGIGSVFGLTAKLEELGLERDQILETEILPGEPVLVKLLLKAQRRLAKDQIEERVATLKKYIERTAEAEVTAKVPNLPEAKVAEVAIADTAAAELAAVDVAAIVEGKPVVLPPGPKVAPSATEDARVRGLKRMAKASPTAKAKRAAKAAQGKPKAKARPIKGKSRRIASSR